MSFLFFVPSDVVNPLSGTELESDILEMVATNILKMSRYAHGNEFRPFKWEDYVSFCSHSVCNEEQLLIECLANEQRLHKAGDYYVFTEDMLRVYASCTACT